MHGNMAMGIMHGDLSSASFTLLIAHGRVTPVRALSVAFIGLSVLVNAGQPSSQKNLAPKASADRARSLINLKIGERSTAWASIPLVRLLHRRKMLRLPDEIIDMVLKCLDCKSMLELSRTCLRLHAIAMGCEEAWRKLAEASGHFDKDFNLPPGGTWHKALKVERATYL